MARNKFYNRKARIEKKFSKSAMELLIKLRPRSIDRGDFSLEYDDFKWRHGTVYRAQIIRHCRQLVSAGINWDA